MTNCTFPQKEIDLALLIFIERYATSLPKWDILAFFGQHPDKSYSAEEIAVQLGRSIRSVRPELGELALLNVLEKDARHAQPTYCLTRHLPLRALVIKFAGHNRSPA